MIWHGEMREMGMGACGGGGEGSFEPPKGDAGGRGLGKGLS